MYCVVCITLYRGPQVRFYMTHASKIFFLNVNIVTCSLYCVVCINLYKGPQVRFYDTCKQNILSQCKYCIHVLCIVLFA